VRSSPIANACLKITQSLHIAALRVCSNDALAWVCSNDTRALCGVVYCGVCAAVTIHVPCVVWCIVVYCGVCAAVTIHLPCVVWCIVVYVLQ
jgi:hypothetical protein